VPVNLIIERSDAREWTDEQLQALFSEGFPEFIVADRLAEQDIHRVRGWFPAPTPMLVDERGRPVAGGWGIPIRWDGRPETLPTGYTDATIRAVEGREQGVEPDTLVICGAVVAGELKGRGLAGETPKALRGPAREAGWRRGVAMACSPTARFTIGCRFADVGGSSRWARVSVPRPKSCCAISQGCTGPEARSTTLRSRRRAAS